MIALFQEQAFYLHFFRKLGEGQSFFLSLLDVDCFQLQIICVSKSIWGWQILLPYNPEEFSFWSFTPHGTQSSTILVAPCFLLFPSLVLLFQSQKNLKKRERRKGKKKARENKTKTFISLYNIEKKNLAIIFHCLGSVSHPPFLGP